MIWINFQNDAIIIAQMILNELNNKEVCYCYFSALYELALSRNPAKLASSFSDSYARQN